jgi:hypothetical protein
MTIRAECIQASSPALVKVEEGRMKAVIRNASNLAVRKIHYDGCCINNATACDYLVHFISACTVFIELKGSDVGHACNQIEESVKRLKYDQGLCKPWAALVVCTQYPRQTTKVQLARKRFRDSYKMPLHVVCGNREHDLGTLLRY